jgi:hypothetical protein
MTVIPFRRLCDWCASSYARAEFYELPGLIFCDETCYLAWWRSQWDSHQR